MYVCQEGLFREVERTIAKSLHYDIIRHAYCCLQKFGVHIKVEMTKVGFVDINTANLKLHTAAFIGSYMGIYPTCME